MASSTPQRLGEFELVSELGRGGMGVVYEAVQTSLGRRVALKVLGTSLGLTPQAVERFRREAAAAAKLHHTNIVPVYATGQDGGTHYYAMELIDGPSLDRALRQLREVTPDSTGPPASHVDAAIQTAAYDHTEPVVAAVGLGASSLGSAGQFYDVAARMIAGVADALDYAHRQGVLHRDVKPANLLLSPDGRLSLNDFGLARVLEQPGMTQTGEFLGTPAYMSPEQITGGRVPIDGRTDVYSLGATLYEMLTLTPPFGGTSRDQVLAQILHKEPVAPRKINPKVPVDLETICLKCLEKDPDRRYATAGALADDLRRFVNRFAIAAKRAGPMTRALKWGRRHPGVAALLGVLLLAVTVAGYYARQSRVAARQAAIDSAILAAMSGETEGALTAIAEADDLGADKGQLDQLRGLVALNSGRPSEAIVYLKKADERLGGTVAVRALLAQAYNDDGQYERSEAMALELSQSVPKSLEDSVFLGLALAEQDPVQAVAVLDRALTRPRPPPVARLVRASALTQLARMTGKADDAERALADLQKLDLSDNPIYLNVRKSTLLTLAHNCGPNDPRAAKALTEASAVVQSLAKFPDLPSAAVGRCTYYFVIGNDDGILTVIDEVSGRFQHNYLDDYVRYVHYRRKQYAEALAVATGRSLRGYEAAVQLQQAIILAAMPGRTAEVEGKLAEIPHSYRRGTSLASFPAYWQLLGPTGRVRTRDTSRKTLLDAAQLIPTWRDGWYRHLLAFHAETIDADELLTRAGESQFNRCEAYFYIGLRALGEGKRTEAKDWFTKCADTGVSSFIESIWSRAFLTHIDDKSWMPQCR
ncbi:MAG: protein kinase [Gemmataceae bacterium]